jgi:hypothetical protein
MTRIRDRLVESAVVQDESSAAYGGFLAVGFRMRRSDMGLVLTGNSGVLNRLQIEKTDTAAPRRFRQMR